MKARSPRLRISVFKFRANKNGLVSPTDSNLLTRDPAASRLFDLLPPTVGILDRALQRIKVAVHSAA